MTLNGLLNFTINCEQWLHRFKFRMIYATEWNLLAFWEKCRYRLCKHKIITLIKLFESIWLHICVLSRKILLICLFLRWKTNVWLIEYVFVAWDVLGVLVPIFLFYELVHLNLLLLELIKLGLKLFVLSRLELVIHIINGVCPLAHFK